MSAKLRQNAEIANENTLKDSQHMLFVLSSIDDKNIPFKDNLDTKLKRIKSEFNDLNKTPLAIELPNGGIASYVILDRQLNMFQRHTLLRKAIKPIIAEQTENIDICVFGDEAIKEAHAYAAYYVVTVNVANLPSRKKEHKPNALKCVTIHGYKATHDYAYVNARVAGNTLCRELTITPPNDLTPTLYRQKIAKLALENGWHHKESICIHLKNWVLAPLSL